MEYNLYVQQVIFKCNADSLTSTENNFTVDSHLTLEI